MNTPADTEFVRELLAQAHEIHQFHEVVEYTNDAVWAVRIDEDTEVRLDYDAESQRLFVFCELGVPPEASAQAAYSFFLRYNYQVMETGGARVAMRDETGPLSMIYDLTEAELRAGTLPILFQNLEAVLPAWRSLVAKGLEPGDASPTDDGFLHPSLRV